MAWDDSRVRVVLTARGRGTGASAREAAQRLVNTIGQRRCDLVLHLAQLDGYEPPVREHLETALGSVRDRIGSAYVVGPLRPIVAMGVAMISLSLGLELALVESVDQAGAASEAPQVRLVSRPVRSGP